MPDINKLRADPDFQALSPKDRLDIMVDLGHSDEEIDSVMSGKSATDLSSFKIGDVPGGGALSYAGDVLKNAPGSALRLAGDIAMSPVTVPMALGRAVSDIGQAAMGNRGPLGETAAAIGGHFKQRYGGLSNIAETIRTDPFGVAADVLPVAAGALRIGNVPRLSLAAEKMDPTRMVGSAMTGAVEQFGKGMQAAGVKGYQRALKPPISPSRGLQGISDATRAAETGLLEGIIPTTKLSKVPLAEMARKSGLQPSDLRHIPSHAREGVLSKIAVLEGKAGKELSGVIADLSQQGFKLDRAGKHQLVDEAIKYVKAQHQGAGSEVHQAIDELGDLERNSALPVPGQPGAFIADEMTPAMMQARKQELRSGQVYGKETGKTKPSQLEDEVNKSVAHQLMGQLEKWSPELGGINQKSANYKLLMKAMTDFVRRNRTGPPPTRTSIGYAAGRTAQTLGVGAVAGGLGLAAGAGVSGGASLGAMGILAALAISQPSVKSRLAITLHRVGRATESAGVAGRSAIRIPGIPETLTAGQRTIVEPQKETRRETSKSGKPMMSHDGGKTWEYE